MQVKRLGPNTTELVAKDGSSVLYSYKTPVAAWLLGTGFIKTREKWSPTTSRHINKWLGGAKAEEVDQSVLDGLIRLSQLGDE